MGNISVHTANSIIPVASPLTLQQRHTVPLDDRVRVRDTAKRALVKAHPLL
jgi:hypothetical protein